VGRRGDKKHLRRAEEVEAGAAVERRGERRVALEVEVLLPAHAHLALHDDARAARLRERREERRRRDERERGERREERRRRDERERGEGRGEGEMRGREERGEERCERGGVVTCAAASASEIGGPLTIWCRVTS